MHIKEIQLINFKNYTQAKFDFSDGINCIVGFNGVGKTNLLDAVYYLSMCKSYFNSSDCQNIQHQANFFSIVGSFELDAIEGENKVSCLQQEGKRKVFKFNQKEYNRLADHIGLIPSVLISPCDIDYVNGIAEVRRRYFDAIISQLDSTYLDNLITYNKVVSQRNVVLKKMFENKSFQPKQLALWNDRMENFGAKIHRKRLDFMIDFLPIFEQYFNLISPEKEQVNIVYVSHLFDGDFKAKLEETAQKDYYNQSTSVGTHKDDFRFEFNGYAVKKFCSQGQQKSFLIALKLAQFDYIKKLKKCKPLLLLDDVFDKLDAQRIQELIKMVNGQHFGQVFITDANKERLVNLFKNNGIAFNLIEIQ